MDEPINKFFATLSFLILLSLIVILVSDPKYVFEEVASFRRLKAPSVDQLDQLPETLNLDPGPFWDERNTLEVEVPRDMSLREFLKLYQINMPHVRQQLAQQIDKPITDSHRLKAGERFTIDLTPSVSRR
jgi:hypothetical protein